MLKNISIRRARRIDPASIYAVRIRRDGPITPGGEMNKKAMQAITEALRDALTAYSALDQNGMERVSIAPIWSSRNTGACHTR